MPVLRQCIKPWVICAVGISLAGGAAGASVSPNSSIFRPISQTGPVSPAGLGEVEDWLYQVLGILESVLCAEAASTAVDGPAPLPEEAPAAEVRGRAEDFVRDYKASGVPEDLGLIQRATALQYIATARVLVMSNPTVFADPWWRGTFVPTLNSMEADLASQS